MKIFDFKNPKHVQILREEVTRVKRILSEGAHFSMDEIWKEMTESEQENALLASADDAGPDRADQYVGSKWDSIPSDVQDTLDLSAYELAKYDVEHTARNLRMIKGFADRDAAYAKLVDTYLKNIGRRDIDCLTKKQSSDLMLKLAKLGKQLRGQGNTSIEPKNNPYDMPGGRPSTGYMGSKYTGD